MHKHICKELVEGKLFRHYEVQSKFVIEANTKLSRKKHRCQQKNQIYYNQIEANRRRFYEISLLKHLLFYANSYFTSAKLH